MEQRNNSIKDEVNTMIANAEIRTYYTVAIVALIVSGIGMCLLFK